MLKKKVFKNLAIALGILLVIEAPVYTLATSNTSQTAAINNSTSNHKYFTKINGKTVDGILAPKDFNSKLSNSQLKTPSTLNANFKKAESNTSKSVVSKKTTTNSTKDVATLSKKIKPLIDSKFNSDQLLIKYKASTNLNAKNNFYSLNNLKLKKQTVSSKLDLVTTPKGSNLDTLIAKIKLNPNVEFVQKNYRYTTDAVSNDTMIDKLWGMNNTGQPILNAPGVNDMDIDAPEAWATTKGSSNVVVGVIDTGVDINHTDIKSNIWVNTGEIPGDKIDNDKNGYVDDVNGWDFYNDDNTVFDAEDGDEHGTHVSGTIAASINNSVGVAGVAPLTKIMPLKFIGPYGGDTFSAISALEYAKAKGVKITSNSWGGGSYDPALEDAIKNFGGLFVAAAGNESNDNDSFATYPSSYALDNILSVAAIDNKGQIADFSNYGKTTVDVAAPGVDILSSIPKEPALGAVIGSTLAGKNSVVQGFGNQILTSDTDKKTFFTKVLTYMNVAKTDSVLIVQDDASKNPDEGTPNVSSSYDTIVKALGYSNVKSWNTYTSGYPALSILKQYSAIIWYTGDYIGFDYDSVYTLQDYILAGGKLNLSGTYIAAILDESPLLQALNTDMLYYDFTRSNATQLNGIAGTTFAGTNLNFAPNNFVSYLKPVSIYSTSTKLVNFNTESNYTKSFDYFSGTSMATPHVSGIAALLASKNITNALSLKSMIMNSVTPVKGLDGLMLRPGIVNAAKALTANPDDDIPGLALKSTQTSTLNSSTDIDDVYYISLNAGDKFTVSLTGATGTDFDLHVYSPNAKTVKSSEGIVASSEGTTSTETITYSATETGNYYINAYACSGSGSYTLNYAKASSAKSLTIQDTSKELSFTGNWTSLSNATNYSGGTAKQLNSAGSVIYTGTMETFKWTGFKGPNQGIAKIYLDNELYKQVDLYATAYSYKQTLSQIDLSYGVHTVKIEWTGLKNAVAKKGSSNINIDSIYVTTTKTKPYAPINLDIEDYFINSIDIYFEYPFKESISKFNVYRSTDNVKYSIVGTVSATDGYNGYFYYSDTKLTNDTNYYYKVTAVSSTGIESAPTKSLTGFAKVSNSNYTLDNTSPYLKYTGTWTKETNSSYDNGSRHITLTAGNKITIPFTGYQNEINTFVGPDMGRIKLTFPNGFAFDIDLNSYESGTASFGSSSSYRETGNITIECVSGKIAFDSASIYDITSTAPSAPTNLIGTSNSSKSVLNWTLSSSVDTKGYNIYRSSTSGSGYTKINSSLVTTPTYTDATPLAGNNYYVVKAVNYAGYESVASNSTRVANLTLLQAGIYQDSATGLLYTGTWSSQSSSSYDGGTVKLSSAKDSCIEFKFNGTYFEWYGAKANSYGIAKIQIDGKDVTTVDSYSATAAYKQLLYKSGTLAAGTHTVKIIVTGTKATASTGYSVALDKVVIK